MVKAYILDDEVKAIELLRKYVSKIDFIELVGSSANSLNALSFLQKNKVDLLFLDISMPLLSGVELYKSIITKPKVIFTTAHPEFAVEGFELDAVDYLLKPISFTRFLQACEKVHRGLIGSGSEQSEDSKTVSDTLYIKSGSFIHKISWKDVLYLEKDENYVVYQIVSGERILCRTTLNKLEPLFPSYVRRVHQSFAISMIHTTKIMSTHVQVAGTKIPIGRSFKTNLSS